MNDQTTLCSDCYEQGVETPMVEDNESGYLCPVHDAHPPGECGNFACSGGDGELCVLNTEQLVQEELQRMEKAAASEGWTVNPIRVTVVIPTTDPSTQHFFAAVESVEQQDYPRELVDTHIIHDVEGFGIEFLQRVGVQKAETEWVLLMSDTDVLPAHLLSTGVAAVLINEGTEAWTPDSATCAGPVVLTRRDWFLQ